jgi:hypothetical protein
MSYIITCMSKKYYITVAVNLGVAVAFTGID